MLDSEFLEAALTTARDGILSHPAPIHTFSLDDSFSANSCCLHKSLAKHRFDLLEYTSRLACSRRWSVISDCSLIRALRFRVYVAQTGLASATESEPKPGSTSKPQKHVDASAFGGSKAQQVCLKVDLRKTCFLRAAFCPSRFFAANN
ncbi:unnamed protein product [Protopolystoma xenopodis]|uniref:Uncharacterized protein n=1 Tax=Protopolystoma xenopodis TaxID=117903 RepID=A0A3S5ADS0_9PLAT|nr:unnamed protein product [Protopolystoma xenopodis]